jgi:hypothetical protein
VSASPNPASILRAAAAAALLVGALLVLGSWDGLYDALDLPQSLPALSAQMGGAALVALAYLLWAAATRPELVTVAALTGAIAEGGAGLVIAAWLIFRNSEDLGGIDTLGTALLIGAAVVLTLLALANAWVAFGSRGAGAQAPRGQP